MSRNFEKNIATNIELALLASRKPAMDDEFELKLCHQLYLQYPKPIAMSTINFPRLGDNDILYLSSTTRDLERRGVIKVIPTPDDAFYNLTTDFHSVIIAQTSQ